MKKITIILLFIMNLAYIVNGQVLIGIENKVGDYTLTVDSRTPKYTFDPNVSLIDSLFLICKFNSAPPGCQYYLGSPAGTWRGTIFGLNKFTGELYVLKSKMSIFRMSTGYVINYEIWEGFRSNKYKLNLKLIKK